MPPSAFDFVFALSAEESCPVCSELFASVDQCLCADCGTGMCRDCAGLRPDTRWICRGCADDLPAVAIPRTVRPFGQRLIALRLSLRESALEQTHAARAQLERGARFAREQAVLAARQSAVLLSRSRALALAALLGLIAQSRTGLQTVRAITVRLLSGLGPVLSEWRHDLGVASSRLRTHSWQVGRSSLASLLSLWVRATSLSLTLRTLRLRRYTNSLLIATAILIAVARSQTGPDAR